MRVARFKLRKWSHTAQDQVQRLMFRLKARDSAQGWRAEKRQEEYANRRAEMDERMAERKQKEAATMDM